MTRADHAREIRNSLVDPRAVCEALGIVGGKGTFLSQGQRGITVRCPFHDEKSPSCSVTRAPDGTVRFVCFGCGEKGDVLTLVAKVRGLSTKRDFPRVLIEAALLGGLHSLAYELESGKPTERGPVKAPSPPPIAEPPRDYPPLAEVEALLDECKDPAFDAEVTAHLAARGLDAELVGVSGMALALPPTARLPRWARYQGSTWASTGHRLILPVRDAQGAVRSVRAWRVAEGDSPKRLPPSGHRATGLVLASELTIAWLLGRIDPPRVLVVEGEPDALRATTAWRMSEPTAVLGIVSGSWTPELSRRFRAGQVVFVFTHDDKAGDKYAHEAIRSLLPRGCKVHRWTPKEAA